MERLTASDSWYLYLETPTVHMHVCGIVVVDPASASRELTFERVRDHVASRVAKVAGFRRRLVGVPFGIDHPVWVEDPSVDLDDHLHRHVVRRSHRGALDDFVGRYCSEPLDRSRPLWDMVWVEGLPEGRAALVTKFHHALVDGVTGVGLVAHLLDTSATPVDDGRTPVPRAERPPGPLSATRDAVLGRVADPLRPVRAARRASRAAMALTGASLGSVLGLDRTATPLSSPRTPFNGTLSARRSVATGSTPLASVSEVTRATGASVTEVVLAACTTGLRRHLLRNDAPTHRPLVCSVPASMRRRRDPGGGRQIPANLLVPLPVDVEDPVEQLRQIRRGVASAGKVQDAIGPAVVGDVVELVPPPALRIGASLWSRLGVADRLPPAHNLVVSSVPGAPVPLFLAGAPVADLYPLGFLTEGVGLSVTVVSNEGDLDIGIIACPDLVPDVGGLLSGVVDGFGVLAELAESAETLDLTRPGRVRRKRTPPGAAR